MSKRSYTMHDTVWDRDIPGPRKIGAYSGNPLPSVRSYDYLVLLTTCQGWANAKSRIASGDGDEQDEEEVAGCEQTFARKKVDPRDFGFEDIDTYKLDVPAGTAWGRA
jgi:hypothetical protein